MTYRLLAGAEEDIDRIVLKSAGEWGVAAAERYHLLMLAVFAFPPITECADRRSNFPW